MGRVKTGQERERKRIARRLDARDRAESLEAKPIINLKKTPKNLLDKALANKRSRIGLKV